jgi:hypothetical protein
VEEARAEIDRKKAENYGKSQVGFLTNNINESPNQGFASMAAVPYAHTVAQMLRGKHPKGTTITLAPNPKDIVSTVLSAYTSTNLRFRSGTT